MENKVQVDWSDDYASLKVGDRHFYYGWEEQDEDDGDWLFVYRDGGEVVKTYTESELANGTTNYPLEMTEFLIAGIGLLIKERILK